MTHSSAALKSALALLLLLGASAPAFASNGDTRFEITPFAGYRVGGSFEDSAGDGRLEVNESSAWGLTVNGSVKPNTEWEVFYARQESDIDTSEFNDPSTRFDIDVELLHFGGTYLFDGERVRPFVALTVGATRFDPHLPSYSARTYASMSLGGGWKFRLAEHVGLRLEARGFGTLIDNSSRLFCESDGGGACLIVAEGRILTQWEARAGLSLRF